MIGQMCGKVIPEKDIASKYLIDTRSLFLYKTVPDSNSWRILIKRVRAMYARSLLQNKTHLIFVGIVACVGLWIIDKALYPTSSGGRV